MSSEDRDDQLGAALRALEVPDYEPGFQTELRARLDAQTPPRTPPRPSRAWTPPGWRMPVWRPLAATAALAAVMLAVIFSRDSDRRAGPVPLGTPPATAAELGTRVARAVAQARTLSGTLFTRQRLAPGEPFVTARVAFRVTAAGDQRLTSTGSVASPRSDSAYRVATATETAVDHNGPPNGTRGRIMTGLASGPPDGGPSDLVLRRALAGIVPALRAAGDRRIQPTRYAGRPAWKLSTAALINKDAGPGASGDRLAIIVDRATGFPLRVRETRAGQLVQERRVANLRVDAPMPASTFQISVPAKPTPSRFDSHYKRVPLNRAAKTVGYAPLTPSQLPAGYRRAESSVAQAAGTSGNEGANPISRGVVTTAYRRGFGVVLVTTRRRGAGTPTCSPTGRGSGPCWSDPLGAGEGFFVTEAPLPLTTGALADSRARLVIDPRAIPHVWALTDDLVVTISGDLSRKELIAAATSLRPAR